MTDDNDSEFDLFGELSQTESLELNKRRQRFKAEQSSTFAQLPDDPCDRSTAENRKVFRHLCQRGQFDSAQIISQLFSLAECDAILKIVHGLGQDKSWTTGRHSAFPTTDIPLLTDENGPLTHIADQVKARLFGKLAQYFGFQPLDLAFRDLFLVKYSADAQAGLGMHTDGCLMSFNILVNPSSEFNGGGTYFASTDDVVHIQQGDCVFHNAKIMHRGMPISQGQRFILVGFVDTVDTIEKDKLHQTQSQPTLRS
ncbi:hypothetical protein DFQ28_005315 [Apophysomyces sp. BC1034]|nr:hypothetical protein DFQ30_006144 [Apophysomyces sp. BC1015]KAG0178021.1 hypothetical protein DFQ29_004041 [Apophysomyces sp. BC1021]KAG0188169.1 hypothetical protein DFQ28_005315 [Apophysomyces sp. BC1034]